MATVTGNLSDATQTSMNPGKCDLVIHISDMGSSDTESRVKQMCEGIAGMFPDLLTLVAYPAGQQVIAAESAKSISGHCHAVAYAPEPFSAGIPQVRSRQEYRSAFTFSQSVEARACVVLASDSDLLSSRILKTLVDPILQGGLDLAVSAYRLNPFEGMVNSAILYPLSRVICGGAVRYPLAPDLAVSADAQAYLLQRSLRSNTDNGQTRILWLPLELELAGLKVEQFPVGPRSQAAPGTVSLGDLIAEVVGSLFTDIEASASLWQRNPIRRQRKTFSENASENGLSAAEPLAPDPVPLVESFKLGSTNLQEIWRLVLPPHSLLALKRLAQLPAHEFQMPDSLWVRIVYDFLLAHRSRILSRKHLLGALVPLYLGWVASYVMDIKRIGQEKVEERVETLAATFELDRPYLVSQWRWPDRFNP